MFQTPRLMSWLTVRDNVGLVLAGGDDPRIDALLRAMDLGEYAGSYPGRLSGGMQRRVALARAFVANPGLLLLDEPFLSLDAPVANRLRQLLLDLYGESPATVLFVTHDLREALFLADRILFLSPRPGRVVFDLAVDLPRPRQPEGPDLERLRLALLDQHPDLLAGIVQPAEDTDVPAT
jgi:NitT/TauT family transport system ATP-binding protein